MATIYIVEDDINIREIERYALKNSGYEVEEFEGSASFFKRLEKNIPSLILLDIMLPGVDGLDILTRIRADKATADVPVIMVTAKTSELDKVKGLDLGADDYITKPFQMLELVARVKAQLRRVTKYNQQDVKMNENVIIIGGLVVDKENHECTINDEPLSLTPTEFSILWVLCKNRGKVVDSEKLFEEVWGEKYFVNSTNTIMVHIRHLRDKMNDSAENPKYIKTVWGVGYKIEG